MIYALRQAGVDTSNVLVVHRTAEGRCRDKGIQWARVTVVYNTCHQQVYELKKKTGQPWELHKRK
jgi:hypothetical protein